MKFWAIYDRPGVEVHALPLTIALEQDDTVEEWVGTCCELDVTSSGETMGKAVDATVEATLLYLNTLEELGERRRVFDERDLVPRVIVDHSDQPVIHETAVSVMHIFVGAKSKVFAPAG